ncbi:MAG TPA: ParB/RepB/Spo0J family partition protein [Ktedonobacteraceae bacterium]|nr:ParB/RepB/Spo0J family partition protein [Ktedonobacteraceae bacterium]
MAELLTIPIDLIDVSPHNPRRLFDNDALETLAHSISRLGVLQPILVTKGSGGNRYEIIAGERRWRASQIAKKKEIPALVVEYNDPLLREVQLIENLEREHLNPIDEALAFKSLQERYNYTDVSLAQRLKRGIQFVRGRLELLKLHPTIQQSVIETKISLGVALILSRVEETEMQVQLAEQAEQNKLTANEITQLISRHKFEKRLQTIKANRKQQFERKLQKLAEKGVVVTSESYRSGQHHRIWDLVFTECATCTVKGLFLRDDGQVEDICIEPNCYNELLQSRQERLLEQQRTKRLERLQAFTRVFDSEEVTKAHLQYQLWSMIHAMGPGANNWRNDLKLPPYSDTPEAAAAEWDQMSSWSYEYLLTNIVHLSISYIATLSNSHIPQGLRKNLISNFGIAPELLDEGSAQ